ncbi:MAG: PQQ-dependent sugar dehydrogenase [Hyphomicrobiales bacterium]|nr:PQQ-dependent sugar dehydrogenase [Hyphomicrobiales bacterium]
MKRRRQNKALTQAATPSAEAQWVVGTLALITLVFLLSAGLAQAKPMQSELHKFSVVTVASGLNHPWGMAFLPGGDMLVTERNGGVRLIRDGKLVKQPLVGAPKAYARGQGGLLDIAAHPKFAENRYVYISYAGSGEGGAGTEVARAKFTGDALEGLEVVFKANPKTSGSAHYGGRLAFTPSGDLLVTLGDRYARMKEAQDLNSHMGKVIRIRDDGSIPSDNPFTKREGAKPEIYSYGHRNVQGLALRPGSNQIWTGEFGPQGGDEINIDKPGANYGWPKITYGEDYGGGVISDKTALPNMEQPVVYWRPSISPSGMTFYDGDKFPKWKGNLFVGALSGAHVRRLTLQGDKVTAQEALLEDEGERIRDVRQGPDGFIYLLTDESNGKILRLEPPQ